MDNVESNVCDICPNLVVLRPELAFKGGHKLFLVHRNPLLHLIDYQIPDKRGWAGGYIKWPNSPVAPQGLTLNHLLSTRLYTLCIYHHHGLVQRQPGRLRSGELALCDVVLRGVDSNRV
jgi:hypothetical protein